MAKFSVHLMRLREETAEIEVEADSESDARREATRDRVAGATWTPGDLQFIGPQIVDVRRIDG